MQKRIHSDHHAGPEVKSRSLVDLEPKIRMTLVRDKKLTVDLAKYDVERTDNRGDVSEHMSAGKEFHGRQMRK